MRKLPTHSPLRIVGATNQRFRRVEGKWFHLQESYIRQFDRWFVWLLQYDVYNKRSLGCLIEEVWHQKSWLEEVCGQPVLEIPNDG